MPNTLWVIESHEGHEGHEEKLILKDVDKFGRFSHNTLRSIYDDL